MTLVDKRVDKNVKRAHERYQNPYLCFLPSNFMQYGCLPRMTAFDKTLTINSAIETVNLTYMHVVRLG